MPPAARGGRSDSGSGSVFSFSAAIERDPGHRPRGDGGSKTPSAAAAARPAPAPRERRPEPTTDELIQRLHAKVGHDASLSLTEHLSAGRSLCRLRDRLVAGGGAPTPKGAVRLLAAGISLYRRYAVGDCGGGDDGAAGSGPTDEALQQQMADDSRALVRGSATRLFALLCALEQERRLAQVERGLQALDVDKESREAVAAVGFASLWDAVRDPPARKKRRDGEGGAEVEPEPARGHGGGARTAADEDEEATRAGWKAVLERASSGDVARHALRIGAGCLEDESWQALESIMPLFFRQAAANMAESLLMPEGDADHTSLAAASVLASMTEAQREKKLLAVAQAGESEAGQQVRNAIIQTHAEHTRASHCHSFLLCVAGDARHDAQLPAAGGKRRRAAHAAADARGEHQGGRRPPDDRLARPRRRVRRAHPPACASLPPPRVCARAGWRAPSGSGRTAPTRSSGCAACWRGWPC